MSAAVRAAAALGIGLVWACSGAEGMAAPASQLVAACASCHSPESRNDAIPPINGLNEQRILEALRAYRAGERISQIMHVVAKALSPDETESIARYLSGQEKVESR